MLVRNALRLRARQALAVLDAFAHDPAAFPPLAAVMYRGDRSDGKVGVHRSTDTAIRKYSGLAHAKTRVLPTAPTANTQPR